MNTRELTCLSIIISVYGLLFFIPWVRSGIPVFDFVLAYFRPFFGWKKTIGLRILFFVIGILLNPALYQWLLSVEYKGVNMGLPVLIFTYGEHFLFLIFFDRMFSKKKWPRGF